MILLNESINYLEDLKIYKFSEQTSLMEASYIAMIEMEKDWNSLIKETAIEELREAASTITGTVFNEADNGEKTSIFTKISELLKRFISFIGGLFSKFTEWVKQRLVSNKKLLENKDIIFKGYDLLPEDERWTNGYRFAKTTVINAENASSALDDIVSKAKAAVSSNANISTVNDYCDVKNVEDRQKNIRGAVLNEGPLTQEEFDKKLKEIFTFEKQKINFSKEAVDECFFLVLEYGEKKIKNFVKEKFSKLKNEINKALNEIKKMEKDSSSNDKRKCVSIFSSECRLYTGCIQKVQAKKLHTITIDITQSLAVLKKCYAAGIKGSKDTTTTESTIIDNGLFYVNLI